MASKLPIVKQTAWLSIVPQMAILLFLIYLARISGFNKPLSIGLIAYLLMFYFLKFQIPKYHRRGIAFFKKESFAEAIPQFEKSYLFFKTNPWVDRFRFITLLSSSRMSYTEMALINMAFCYGQIGDGKKSIELYEKTLKEFPDSEIAKASLRMYEAAKNTTEYTAQGFGPNDGPHL
jgi:tetratricopeptide (TPR) repeat protein